MQLRAIEVVSVAMPQLTRVPIARNQRPARVLLVEDDYELRRMVSSVLRHDGYEVIELMNGQELVEYMLRKQARGLRYEEPDVILSDVCMPHRSGLDALRELRLARVSTPVVLMTAFPDQCTDEQSTELGAVTLLEKPFDLDDLRMIVLNLLPRNGSGRGMHN